VIFKRLSLKSLHQIILLFANTKRIVEAGTGVQEFNMNSDKQEVVPSAGIHCHTQFPVGGKL
jgi:hypothetical protein